MTFGRRGIGNFVSAEHDTVGYAFRKRWPHGFVCPFCANKPADVAPALAVVCPRCRKQISITARTILHGTRKSLRSWLRLCWLFCVSEDGISAREVQQLMALTSYQSSWNWLQKLRQAISLAENVPCSGAVLFDVAYLRNAIAAKDREVKVCIAAEIDTDKHLVHRFRCRLLSAAMADSEAGQTQRSKDDRVAETLSSMATGDAVLLLPQDDADWTRELPGANPSLQVGDEFRALGRECVQELESWLRRLYRSALDIRYLQGYVDEFTFRWTRRACQDKMLLCDDLVAALVTPRPMQRQADGLAAADGEIRS